MPELGDGPSPAQRTPTPTQGCCLQQSSAPTQCQSPYSGPASRHHGSSISPLTPPPTLGSYLEISSML